ncbi:MAG: hypothetical protein ACYS3S_20200 [Planctomycetota bacterium]|jgi:hypothetical protein
MTRKYYKYAETHREVDGQKQKAGTTWICGAQTAPGCVDENVTKKPRRKRR